MNQWRIISGNTTDIHSSLGLFFLLLSQFPLHVGETVYGGVTLVMMSGRALTIPRDKAAYMGEIFLCRNLHDRKLKQPCDVSVDGAPCAHLRLRVM